MYVYVKGCATLVERKTDKKLLVAKEINVKGLSERDRAEAMQAHIIKSTVPRRLCIVFVGH